MKLADTTGDPLTANPRGPVEPQTPVECEMVPATDAPPERPADDEGCGCCGAAVAGGRDWCERCERFGHIGEDGPPWMRTYLARTGHNCPFQISLATKDGESARLRTELDAWRAIGAMVAERDPSESARKSVDPSLTKMRLIGVFAANDEMREERTAIRRVGRPDLFDLRRQYADDSPAVLAVIDEYAKAIEERDRLRALIDTPEILDFVRAVQLEAVHQRERWGSDHDAGKTDADWFWLIGYLAGKALHNPGVTPADATEKKLHRIVTVAAAAANWHAAHLGTTNMRPGTEPPKGEG